MFIDLWPTIVRDLADLAFPRSSNAGPPVTDETDTIGDLVACKISGYTRDLENTAGARFYFHPVVSNDVQG